MKRCSWCKDSPLYVDYHDKEWGVPLHDNQKLFEFILLESMQAGLSWITILKKREDFRKAFCEFNPEKIAGFNKRKIQSLMNNPSIIRNERKMISAIGNAKAYLAIQEQGISFDHYIWQFTEGKVIQNKWCHEKEVPANTQISNNMSKQLKKDGFSFVGPTICYAFMQAVGMVNDHVRRCFRYKELLSD